MAVFIRSQLKLLVVLLLMVMLVTTAGCGIVDRMLSFKDQEAAEPEEPSVELPQEPAVDQSEPNTEYLGETTDITLYFADPTGEGLVPVQRTIPKVEGIARATMNELIKGPALDSDLVATIPEGTQLKDINVKDNGLCIVDFSSELVDNHLGGSTAERLTVYSIVNTLTQFPTVDEVQILVDGKYVESIAGHVNVSQAMAPNKDIIINQK